ncbi:MAG: hypothetical protein N2385_10880 [Chloroflexus sp.]|nr:hypothetical protein [Chloroflexus sp.]
MADPDSILQLGVEAARKGEKDEARKLFRLLTREHPENIQGWLWLAGVAEDREERQAALEQVLRLDPKNEMALKGLQALGVTPKPAAPPAAPAPPPPAAPAPPPPAKPAMPDIDEDDPFAQLDALSEVMATDAGPVRRDPDAPRPEPTLGGVAEGERAAAPASPRTSRASEPPPARPSRPSTSWARGSSSSKPAKPAKPARSSGLSFGNLFRRSGPPPRRDDDLEEETVPAKRGLTPLTMVLLGVLLISCIGLGFIFLSQRNNTASVPPAQATSQAATSMAATAEASLAPTTPPTIQPEPTAAPGAEPTPAPTVEPTPEPAPTPPPAVDPAQANPALVSPGTELTSNGWAYDFNQPTYAAPIIGALNGVTPNNGRFVVVLVFVRNTTGQAQPVPLDFFVLKDAQGRVWTPRLDASDAYVIRGINADLSHSEPVPADGFVRSVAILFDVAPDATDLVFFARSNPNQGWLVLSRV